MKKGKILRVLGFVLLSLVLLLTLGPFLVPVPSLQGTKPVQELADNDSRFMEINGVTLHYKDAGEGEPAIMLLHGFGANLFSWQAVMKPLSEHGTVIAYDRPAFGLTERPMAWEGMNPYSTEFNLFLLKGLMDKTGIQKAILVGNSAGGTLAVQFALQYPDRVMALILVDPAIYEQGGGPAWLEPLYHTPQMDHLGPLLVRSIASSGVKAIRMAWHDPTRISQQILDDYSRPLQAENWDRGLWFFITARTDTDLALELGKLNLPVLVISGDDDMIVPTASTIRVSEEIPGAQLVIIPSAGHVPHEEQPEHFMQAIDQFLESVQELNRDQKFIDLAKKD